MLRKTSVAEIYDTVDLLPMKSKDGQKGKNSASNKAGNYGWCGTKRQPGAGQLTLRVELSRLLLMCQFEGTTAGQTSMKWMTRGKEDLTGLY